MIRNTIASAALAAALAAGAAHATTLNGGGSSLAYPTYVAEFKAFTAAHSTVGFTYEAVGSGAGQTGFLNNTISSYITSPNLSSTTLTWPTLQSALPASTATVHFGASDAALVASQLTAAATGTYGLSATNGPLIQLPTFGTPITIPYLQAKQTTTLVLTDNQLCGIFSGKITDWHSINSAIAAGTSIYVVYRTDGSGTSFLLTQHLGQVCTTANSNFATLPFSATTSFANLFATLPSNFVGAKGSGAVAKAVLGTAGAIGYLSPDYTSIAPSSVNTTALKVASLLNSANNSVYTPSVANTSLALSNPGTWYVESSVTSGALVAGTQPTTKTLAQNPLNWVPLIPKPAKGYPIVGYTTVDVSSCYADTTVASNVILFLEDQYNSAFGSIINQGGFTTLANTGAAGLVTYALNNLLGNANKYNINIENGILCAGKAGR